MEELRMTRTSTGVHVEGFPNAAKVVKIESGKKARRLADMGAHLTDLQFANECLDAINAVPAESRVMRTALWRSAVVHFAKCFGDSAARGQLTREQVFGAEINSKEAFEYFISLRHKHVAHDDNAFLQSMPVAVVNNEGEPHKIAKIGCITAVAETLDQGHWNN